ncbi:MAG: TRZ/ATZ family hydrolase, partial [Oleiphilaceae bacterium]|nr:TRZ/ATZ family hydrolase [Oleiphilaceae bacterium]
MSAEPKSVDLMLTARWIIPVQPANRILEDHALVVHSGRIEAILPIDEAHQRYVPKERRNLDRHVLIPGLINTHGHAAMTLLRGYAEDAPLAEWLTQHIWPLESRLVNETFVRDGTRL